MCTENQFARGTLPWKLMEMSIKNGSIDMTSKEIAELMDVEPTKVRVAMRRVFLRTGHMVKYRRVESGRKRISEAAEEIEGKKEDEPKGIE